MHPYESDPAPYQARIPLLEEGTERFVEFAEDRAGGRLPEPRRSRMLANDPRALIAATQANLVNERLDESLESIATPTFIYCGTVDAFLDGAKWAADTIPQAQFMPLDGLNHGEVMLRADLLLPAATEFLGA